MMLLAVGLMGVAHSIPPEVILGTQEEINKEYADRVKNAESVLKNARDSIAKEKQEITEGLKKKRDDIKKDLDDNIKAEEKKQKDALEDIKKQQDSLGKMKMQVDKEVAKINQDSSNDIAQIEKIHAKR